MDKQAVLAELAPKGELRFAINHGNVVLVNPGSAEGLSLIHI